MVNHFEEIVLLRIVYKFYFEYKLKYQHYNFMEILKRNIDTETRLLYKMFNLICSSMKLDLTRTFVHQAQYKTLWSL